MRLATPLLIVALAVAGLCGCGSASDSGGAGNSTATSAGQPAAPSGASAAQLEASWRKASGCAPDGASRSACTVGGYRCLAVEADRGTEVSCSAPGEAVNFTVPRR